jgi:hypothetical protein
MIGKGLAVDWTHFPKRAPKDCNDWKKILSIIGTTIPMVDRLTAAALYDELNISSTCSSTSRS